MLTLKIIILFNIIIFLYIRELVKNQFKMNIDKILLILIIANVGFSLKGFNDRLFFDKYKFQIGAINRGEKIRMLTSAFLHVDYLHLILNMYVLYIFAPIIIVKLGIIKFLVLYFGSLLAGSFLTQSYHNKELYYSAVGASGAVSIGAAASSAFAVASVTASTVVSGLGSIWKIDLRGWEDRKVHFTSSRSRRRSGRVLP